MSKVLSIFFLLLLSAGLRSQPAYLDSLNRVIRYGTNDSLRLDAMRDMADHLPTEQYVPFNRLIIAWAETKAACVAPGSRQWKMYAYHQADAYYNSALCISGMAFPDSSLPFYQKGIELGKKAESWLHVAYCELSIGLIYTERGRFIEGTKLLYSALRRTEELKDYLGMGEIYMHIGVLYYRQRDYEKAIENHKQACRVFEKGKYDHGLADAIGKLAMAYHANGNMKEYVAMMDSSIRVLSLLGDEDEDFREEMLSSHKGLMYYWKGEWEKAIPHLKRAITQAEDAGSLYGQGSNYYHVGLAYEKLKNYPEALLYARKALELSREKSEIYLESQVTQLLYWIYKATGNYQDAFEMNDLSRSLHDTIQKREVKEKVLEQQFKYEYEKKELMARANEEKKLNELKLESGLKNTRKNQWLMVLCFAFILLAASSCFLYNHYRQKNVIHTQKNNLLKQQLLLSQMNPHFIFNSLNAIQNFVMKQDSMQAGIYLSQFAAMMRMILDFSRKDYISLESELHFLNHYMELQQLRTGHTFSYSFEVGEDIEPDMLLVPPMLTQPFIENAIEHGGFRQHKKGEIRIRFYREDDMLVGVIDDNGVGLRASAEQQHQSEKKYESLARMETLYHDRMDKCRILIEDKKDRDPATSGVKVTFVIPCKEA